MGRPVITTNSGSDSDNQGGFPPQQTQLYTAWGGGVTTTPPQHNNPGFGNFPPQQQPFGQQNNPGLSGFPPQRQPFGQQNNTAFGGNPFNQGTMYGGQGSLNMQQQPNNQSLGFNMQPQQQFNQGSFNQQGNNFNNYQQPQNNNYATGGNNNQTTDVPDDIKDLMKNRGEAIKWNESLGELPDAFFKCLKKMGEGPIATSTLANNILTEIQTTYFNNTTELPCLSHDTHFFKQGVPRCKCERQFKLKKLVEEYCNYALTGEEPENFTNQFKTFFANALVYNYTDISPTGVYGDYGTYKQAFDEYTKILSNTEPALEMPADPTYGTLRGLELDNLTGITSLATAPDIVYVLNQTLNKISYEKFKGIYTNVTSGSETNLAHIKQLPYYILALKFQAKNNGKPLIIQSKEVVKLYIQAIKHSLGTKYDTLKAQLKTNENEKLNNRKAIVAKRGGSTKSKNLKVGEILEAIINDLKTGKFPEPALKHSKYDYAARAIRKAYKIDHVPGLQKLLKHIQDYTYTAPPIAADLIADDFCNPKIYGYSAHGLNLIMTTLFYFDYWRKKYLCSSSTDSKIATITSSLRRSYNDIKNLDDTIKNLNTKSRKTPTITHEEHIEKIKKIPELIKNMEKKMAKPPFKSPVFDVIKDL